MNGTMSAGNLPPEAAGGEGIGAGFAAAMAPCGGIGIGAFAGMVGGGLAAAAAAALGAGVGAVAAALAGALVVSGLGKEVKPPTPMAPVGTIPTRRRPR